MLTQGGERMESLIFCFFQIMLLGMDSGFALYPGWHLALRVLHQGLDLGNLEVR